MKNASAVSSEDKSIAVLPLVNTSGDVANDYFSDGLSEELIAVLAKIPGLKIIGRNSSFLVCREALVLDPLLTTLWYNLGRLAVATGRYQEAEETFRKGLELQPHAARFHTYLATLDILQNNSAHALQNAQLESDGFWRDYALTLTEQTQSDRSAADSALKNFSSKYANNGAYQIALLYAVRKEPDEMFRWLDNAYATHDSGLTQLVITPFLRHYRDDPRFIALCQKLGVQIPAAPSKP